MTLKTCYPQTVSQSSGAPYRQFENLNNIKDNNSSYARSKNISGGIGSKTGTYHTPARITATNFKANIPANATINSVTVEYATYKQGNINIGKTSVDLVGVDTAPLYGKALTGTIATSSIKFTSPKLTVSAVNSANFGFTLFFPQNTAYDTGYVIVKFVRIIIDYVLPSFSFSLTKDKADCYENDTLNINATINNTNNTSYNPSVRIELPSTVTYSGFIGDGSITNNGNVLTWNPNITSKTKSRTVQITIELNTISTDNIVQISENTTGATQALTFDIVENPAAVIEEPEEEEAPTVYIEPEIGEIPTVTVKQNNPFMVGNTLTSEQSQSMSTWQPGCPVGHFYLFMNPSFSDSFRNFNTETGKYEYDFTKGMDDGYVYYDDDLKIQSVDTASGKFNVATVDKITLVLLGGTVTLDNNTVIADLELARFNLDIFPATLTTPSLTLLQLTQEELGRLGTGYNYIIQSYLKEVTEDTYVRDWGKNFRIGVFNNAIKGNITGFSLVNSDGETEEIIYDGTDYNRLSMDEIFANAEYWSEPLKNVNEYTNLTCEFVYNEDYPLYILIVGDYTEANPIDSIKFTEPCIVESDDYKGWVRNGNFPKPIKSTIIPSKGNADLSVQSFEISNTIIAYDIPVENTFDANDIIKGIGVDFDVEYTDMLSLNVLLKSPTGETGERSIITDPSSSHISLGGSTDKWGFKPGNLTNLEDWEILVYVNNVFESGADGGEIQFNNLTVTFYSTKITPNLYQVFIDGEDMAVYDAFILDVKVPQGLKTNTKSWSNENIDGNEINKQTIKEKDIEIDFSINACTIEEASQSLQEIAALLVNKRTELNKPIPKRLELSHFPGLYWEYVIKDTLEVLDSETYESSAKLEIPSGTAFTKDEIVTSNIGKVEGIAKINPKIVIIPTNNHIELLESISEQKFTMTYNDWDNHCTVEIDCAERTVFLKKPETNGLIDISSDVDWDVDWFILHGEYDFNTTGCILQSVTRTERR